jgi:hypothetical protein
MDLSITITRRNISQTWWTRTRFAFKQVHWYYEEYIYLWQQYSILLYWQSYFRQTVLLRFPQTWYHLVSHVSRSARNARNCLRESQMTSLHCSSTGSRYIYEPCVILWGFSELCVKAVFDSRFQTKLGLRDLMKRVRWAVS